MLTCSININAPISKVWNCFTLPEHITQWNFAHESWHCPASTNDVTNGGKFVTTMAAKDGSYQFDFSGRYDVVIENEALQVTLDDGRKWNTYFSESNGITTIKEEFEPESQNPEEMQVAGWQAILDSFKKYVEAN